MVDVAKGSSTAVSAYVNLLNTILGAGMLAMPYAVRANGVLLGVFIIVWSACASGFGLYVQSVCTRFVPPGQASFFALSQLTYPSLSVVFDIAIAIKCFGVGVSYLVVLGDLLPQIAASFLPGDTGDSSGSNTHPLLLERNFWISVCMVIVIPLSFLKKLDSLRYASLVALSSVAYLVLLILGHFFIGDTLGQRGDVEYFKPAGVAPFFSVFPIFVFAYTCHQNMFALVNELEDKSSKNIFRFIRAAMTTAVVLYCVVGVFGYLSFGSNISGNIVALYPPNVTSIVGKIAIAVLVVLSYPLQCHPCRASVNHVVRYFELKYAAESENSGAETAQPGAVESLENARLLSAGQELPGRVSVEQMLAEEEVPEEEVKDHSTVVMSDLRFILYTAGIIISSYIVAMTVSSLQHVLAFVGATGSTSISFILPGIFGYQLIGSSVDSQEFSLKRRIVKYLSGALAVWGTLVMVVCLSATIVLGSGE